MQSPTIYGRMVTVIITKISICVNFVKIQASAFPICPFEVSTTPTQHARKYPRQRYKVRVRAWAQNSTLATVCACSEKNYRVSPLSPEDITSENVLREKKPILVINDCWKSMCVHFTIRQSWKKTCGYRSSVMKVESENTSSTNEN